MQTATRPRTVRNPDMHLAPPNDGRPRLIIGDLHVVPQLAAHDGAPCQEFPAAAFAQKLLRGGPLAGVTRAAASASVIGGSMKSPFVMPANLHGFCRYGARPSPAP